MHAYLKKYILGVVACLPLYAYAASPVPDIACRQGKLLLNKVPASEKKIQLEYVKNYLRELDGNMFLDYNPAFVSDQFEIKDIELTSYDETVVHQKITDQIESKFIVEKDPADDTCVLMQQTILDKSPKKKKTKVVKKPTNVSVYRACLTTLTKGQTIFNKHTRISNQQTKQPEYPYTICTIKNDEY